MTQDYVAPVPFGAVDRGVILEDVVGCVHGLVGEHATVAADDFHLQLARLYLAVLSVAKPFKLRG
jgi:hypothetical protein